MRPPADWELSARACARVCWGPGDHQLPCGHARPAFPTPRNVRTHCAVQKGSCEGLLAKPQAHLWQTVLHK